MVTREPPRGQVRIGPQALDIAPQARDQRPSLDACPPMSTDDDIGPISKSRPSHRKAIGGLMTHTDGFVISGRNVAVKAEDDGTTTVLASDYLIELSRLCR